MTSILLVTSLGILFPTCCEAQEAVRLIDLTHPFDQNTIYWPTNRSFRLDVVHKGLTVKGYWYETHDYSASEHGGTHIDAPVHFAKGKWTIDAIPLTHLVSPAIKVDVSAKAHPDYLISEHDLIAWEERHSRIPVGAIVLVYTGWEKFWLDKKRYLGSDKPGDASDLHFPGFGEEAALFLTKKRTIHAVGLDTASLDYGQSKEFLAHRIFGGANIPGFENLHNLDLLPASGFRVLALPMKIGKGSGAPLRIIAETTSRP
ncbi:MAG: cyclase family protein [Gammaproteobacteria bacterium]